MSNLQLNPDAPLIQLGPVVLNRTIVFTWLVMLLMVVVSRLITRRLTSGVQMSRWQNGLEVIVSALRRQIEEVGNQQASRYLPFIGSLFLFLAVSNLLAVVPGFVSPTTSLSTATALAICVFIAVPFFGITQQGLSSYVRQYLQPSAFMLPFNVIGELSRTLALAVRLYGNMMSGAVIGGILLAFVPLFIPVVMQVFGLLTGMIQAYIFSVLAMVYIASATQTQRSQRSGGSEIASEHSHSETSARAEE